VRNGRLPRIAMARRRGKRVGSMALMAASRA
jgi:hypothetical protein